MQLLKNCTGIARYVNRRCLASKMSGPCFFCDVPGGLNHSGLDSAIDTASWCKPWKSVNFL
jgi:hypothetical protein